MSLSFTSIDKFYCQLSSVHFIYLFSTTFFYYLMFLFSFPFPLSFTLPPPPPINILFSPLLFSYLLFSPLLYSSLLFYPLLSSPIVSSLLFTSLLCYPLLFTSLLCYPLLFSSLLFSSLLFSSLSLAAEPTSGLDSGTSISLMNSLHSLAALGVNVVATLHQPRNEIFNLVDSLLLLAPGGTYMKLQSAKVQLYL